MIRKALITNCNGPVLLLLAVVIALDVMGQQRGGIVRRLQFPAGRSSIAVAGEVRPGKKDTYIFRARKSQIISVDLIWQGERIDGDGDQGLSGLIFTEPNGKSYKDPQDFYFEAGATGDYQLVIRPPYKMTNYRYSFELKIEKASDQDQSENLRPVEGSQNAQSLKKYVGKYPRQLFKGAPGIVRRLKALLGKNYDLIELNMMVQSPIKLEDGILLMEGNAPHAGGVEDAYLAITLVDGNLHCAIRSDDFGGRVRVFSEDSKNLPAAIRQLIE